MRAIFGSPKCGRGLSLRSGAGFTLLEVLVAVAILGLALTVILSAQTGLFARSRHTHDVVTIGALARCKMAEVEANLLKLGYPYTEVKEDGPCCETDPDPTFTCEWKIQRVELPQPAGMDAGGSAIGSAKPFGAGITGPNLGSPGATNPFMGGGMPMPGMGSPSAFSDGGLPTGDGGIGALGGALQATGGPQGIAAMAMSMVYPTLKPMLEASIRKIVVTVVWKEGYNRKTFEITQYVTNPTQGGFMMGPDGGVMPIPTASGAASGMPAGFPPGGLQGLGIPGLGQTPGAR